MKKIFVLFVFSFCFNSSFAQVWEEQLLLKNENATIAEKITAFENYKSLHPYTKGNGYKPYARSLYFLEKRMPENTGQQRYSYGGEETLDVVIEDQQGDGGKDLR